MACRSVWRRALFLIASLALAACGSETLTESDAGRPSADGSSNVGTGRGGAGAIGTTGGAGGATGVAGAAGTAGFAGETGASGAGGTSGAAGARGTAGATGAGGNAAAGGSGGTTGACNSLVNSAAAIGEFQAATDPPAALGGTIVDGTYDLSQAITYTGPGGASGPSGTTIQDTIVITNAASGTATVQEVSSTDGTMDGRVSFTFTPAGTMATAAITCPTPSSVGFGYTATGTTFIVLIADQASVYTRQ